MYVHYVLRDIEIVNETNVHSIRHVSHTFLNYHKVGFSIFVYEEYIHNNTITKPFVIYFN